MLTLGVIGAGNMGLAIMRGAIARAVVPAGEMLVAEVDEARRAAAAELGCRVTADAGEVLPCRNLMLAVKPQSFAEVAASIGRLETPTVVISIMAGLSSGNIRDRLGEHARVIRIMPNTPCQIGRGVSGLAIGEGAERGDDDLARRLFGTIGEVVEVDEAQMYAVTAVSGSGPAYVFRLAELMERAAIEVGIEPEKARALAVGTVAGAGMLLAESGRTAGELREAVTSPGGTTAAALEVFESRGLPSIVADAVKAARDRGVELDG